MSSEFTAKQAREILENRNQINKESWYAKNKDQIFNWISRAALNGDNVIVFNSKIWEEKDDYRKHLEGNLIKLGYDFYYNDSGLNVRW